MPVVHSGHVAKTSTRIKNRISDERHCFESGIHPRRSFEGSSKLLLKSARSKVTFQKSSTVAMCEKGTSTRIKNRISDEGHCFESGIHPGRSC